MKTENKVVKWVFIAFVLAVPLACKHIGATSSNSNSNTDGSAKATATPLERPLQITEPRTFRYANLQFTLNKAVISNRVANDQPQDNTNQALADITFSVVNPLKDAVSIRGALWQLKLGDGSVYKQPYEDNLASRDTKERMITFRVPLSSEWKGAQLTLDEKDKEPATLVLEGSAQPQLYPAKLVSGDETTTKAPGMTFTILDASVDVDGAGQRAALGKRYLNLLVRVANKEAGGGGGEFLPEFFRLMIDGVPSAPENMSENNISNGQSSQDVTLSFVIPESATKVELEVGKPDIQQTARIPIAWKVTRSGATASL
ncbi:MAG: hypothetical protein ABI967_13740 [bacterium]